VTTPRPARTTSGDLNMDISTLQEADIASAIALWRAAGLTRPWNDPETDIRLALSSSSSTILCGHVDGALAATAMVGADGHRGWVYYLAVAEAQRGHGYGRAMMRACEAWIASQGVRKMNLMIRTDNKPVAAFYKAIGYEDAEVRTLSRWVVRDE
jgi:ribosomal protein S18 acetylase RimI-like enzyme